VSSKEEYSHRRTPEDLAALTPEVVRKIEPRALHDIAAGLGQERTLKEYQLFSGVDFANQTFSRHARKGNPAQPLGTNGHLPAKPAFSIISKHKPRKVLESSDGVVFDDFLPEDVYNQIYHYACIADYERINTRGKVQKVWRLRDGFPLRSLFSLYFFPVAARRPNPKPDWAYPTDTALDIFADHLNMVAPQAAPFIGQPGKDWGRYSVSAWIYPKDTALSLHDDGSGVYSGAYTYFLNPYWDVHWGGLLMFIDPRSSKGLQHFKTPETVHAYFKRKWIDPEQENSFIWDPGFAQCIFPKRNRIVFIHPESYHFITKVCPDAGDNARMSFAGFFMRPKKKK